MKTMLLSLSLIVFCFGMVTGDPIQKQVEPQFENLISQECDYVFSYEAPVAIKELEARQPLVMTIVSYRAAEVSIEREFIEPVTCLAITEQATTTTTLGGDALPDTGESWQHLTTYTNPALVLPLWPTSCSIAYIRKARV